MAAAIRARAGHDCELVAGDQGIFDVTADEKLVFSKHAEGRFPGEDEILENLD
ncbi:MAG: Rdx family protein [Deltaproteobacteria bacterium]|nr:Rdx family protein [Deltaproteobacteria bacterium]